MDVGLKGLELSLLVPLVFYKEEVAPLPHKQAVGPTIEPQNVKFKKDVLNAPRLAPLYKVVAHAFLDLSLSARHDSHHPCARTCGNNSTWALAWGGILRLAVQTQC